MEFELSEVHRDIRRSAHRLAEAEFAEEAFTWHDEHPEENARILGEHGYLGLTLPEAYGGGGMTWFDNLMVVEGVGAVCPDTARVIVESNSGNLQILAEYAAESVKEQYLPPVCEGRSFISIAMSELDAGSAVTEMETTAERDGDEYVINGAKAWVSDAPRADAHVTYARMPDGHIGSLLVDAETPGLTVAEPDENMADEPQSQLFFDDARVPVENELLTGEDAFRRQMQTYNVNRVMGLAYNWVAAKWLFEDALSYAREREQFGQPIGDFQAVQHRLADMALQLETSRYLIYRALSGETLPGRLLSSMAKVYVSEATHDVVDDALQIKAAAGFVGDTPESYAYRRLRGSQIYSGTNDIHRNIIAESLYRDGYPDIA